MQQKKRFILKSLLCAAAASRWVNLRAQTLYASAPWIVGQIAPLSGPLGPASLQLVSGIQLYLDKINAGGGIGGKPLRLISYDDKYSATEATRQFDALMALPTKPLALLGAFGTDNTEALLKHPSFIQSKLPLVGGRTGATVLRTPANKQIFHLRASYHDEIDKIVEQLTIIGIKSIGIAYQSGGFGQDGLAGLKAAMQKRGLAVARETQFDLKAENLTQAIKHLQGNMPAALVLVGSAGPATAFIREFRKSGGSAQVFGISTVDSGMLISTLGPQAARGIMISQAMPDPKQKKFLFTRNFIADAELFGNSKFTPNFASLEGYLIGKVFTEALRRSLPTPTPERITQALEQMQKFDVGGLTISFSSDNHVGTRYVETSIISLEGKLLN
jgi:branched-chain amino acid transport system substrate-binding protein